MVGAYQNTDFANDQRLSRQRNYEVEKKSSIVQLEASESHPLEAKTITVCLLMLIHHSLSLPDSGLKRDY